jgi:hypothetical protein
LSERKTYPLRLAPELYEALRVWADDELRSVNAQIEFVLVTALRHAGRPVRRPGQPKPEPPAEPG